MFCQDLLTLTDRIGINTLALGARVSAMLASVEQAEAGGLISYGPNFSDLFSARGRLRRQNAGFRKWANAAVPRSLANPSAAILAPITTN